MGVAVKAELRVLVIEARGGIELVEDVTPLVRGIEGGVDDGEVAHLPDHLQVAQPLFILARELMAGPVDRFLGERIEACEVLFEGGQLVVVALHHRAIDVADDFQALVRVGVVTDDVAETDVVRYLVLLGVGQDGLERLEIGMDVSENGKSHGQGGEAWAWIGSRIDAPGGWNLHKS